MTLATVSTTGVDEPAALRIPVPGDLDLYYFGLGTHERLWEVLGNHPYETGTSFAVWAPNAKRVMLVGDTPGWGPFDGIDMVPMGNSGVWHLAVEGIGHGERYKYKVHGADDVWREKADPMAQATECPPNMASVVYRSRYQWQDETWLATRAAAGAPHQRPLSIYEVHLGSWRPGLNYVELAEQLTEYVARLGFTHVELMPVMEHPFSPSWGYQITGYYAPTARFGSPDEFRYLVDRLHQAGVGVILDWVPAHFPKDDWALARFDGTPLYEHPDPRLGEHPDWGTYIFDYGRNQVRNFLVANALYWFDQFHIDGMRVDAVASMLYLDYSREHGQWAPNPDGSNHNTYAIALLRELNTVVYRNHPDVMMIAEESTAWEGVSRPVDCGGLGFGFKWNMGWMHDTLHYVQKDPVHRMYHHDQLTLPALYAFSEQYILPISHDEVVHGKQALTAKLPGDRWQRLAGLRGLLAYMWAFPGKQLLFMGSELAMEHEWDAERSLPWHCLDDPAVASIGKLIAELNQLYRSEPALFSQDSVPDGFTSVVHDDGASNVYAFARTGLDGSMILCMANFSGIARTNYQLSMPKAGTWVEVLNTDAEAFGGSGTGNMGRVRTGRNRMATLHVGPFATVLLRHAGKGKASAGGGGRGGEHGAAESGN